MLRSTAKSLIFHVSRRSGLNAAARWRARRHLVVLCYHGVVSGDHSSDRFRYENTVGQAEFATQMEMISRAFHPVGAGEVEAWVQGRGTLPARPLLVTFDDGYRNNLTIAAPLLRQYGIPAVFHVSTSYIGTSRILWPEEVANLVLAWKGTLPLPEGGAAGIELPADLYAQRRLAVEIQQRCKGLESAERDAYLARLREQTPEATEPDQELFGFLSWDEVRALVRQGFEIGSHTMTHPILSRIPEEVLRTELQTSRRIVESETGQACRCLAYPNGRREDFSTQVVEEARKAGYSLAFSTVPRYVKAGDSPLEISRIVIQGHLPASVFHAWVSGWKSRFR